MQDPQRIWELGRWIARREAGSVRLGWVDGEVVLAVREGRIHGIFGSDTSELGRRLGCDTAGEEELLAEARALGEAHSIPETKAVGAVKKILQDHVRQWLTDPDRTMTIEDEPPHAFSGTTISITHAIVELVLADTRDDVVGRILPDTGVSLQRSADFIELYAPLRLSEEADLIVAGMTTNETAAAIAESSEHPANEVLRLMAALVATGVLEVSEPPEIIRDDLDWAADDFDVEAVPRRIPVWVFGGVAVVVVIILAIAGWFIFGSGSDQNAAAAVTGDWGVVVEMGCEPEDLQRMLRKRNTERKSLRTVKADPANGDTCFRLVWGSFPNQQEAEEALEDVPPDLIDEGFEPHVVEVSEGDASDVDGADS